MKVMVLAICLLEGTCISFNVRGPAQRDETPTQVLVQAPSPAASAGALSGARPPLHAELS